jgi:hypothetical protein
LGLAERIGVQPELLAHLAFATGGTVAGCLGGCGHGGFRNGVRTKLTQCPDGIKMSYACRLTTCT